MNPYRPLFVEKEPMNVQYALSYEETMEAVKLWLKEKKGVLTTDSLYLYCAGGIVSKTDDQRILVLVENNV